MDAATLTLGTLPPSGTAASWARPHSPRARPNGLGVNVSIEATPVVILGDIPFEPSRVRVRIVATGEVARVSRDEVTPIPVEPAPVETPAPKRAAVGHSYRDSPGLTNRANSAMLRIEMIMARKDVSAAARLVLIAEVMAGEPVLTDGSTAAFGARREAAARGEYAPIAV